MIQEVTAKSILRKQKNVDSWFLSSCGMNLYRGCLHNCSYCDGRSEKYNVAGVFGKDVEVKINAIDLLSKELDPRRRRVPLKKGYVLLGGGVCDAYQPVENKYLLSRRTLELIKKFNYPVHILTKSTLVLRDIDLISAICNESGSVVSFSFSSCNDSISRVLEPGVPRASERLDAIRALKQHNIPCGMFLMPVIPFITDTEEIMEESISKAKEAGIDFIVFGGLTLKEGEQKNHFMDLLQQFRPELMSAYNNLYTSNKWGNANSEYYYTINKRFYQLAKKYHVAVRMLFHLFSGILSENEKIVVMLEHLHYIFQLKGESSFFGLAAHSIAEVKNPLSQCKDQIKTFKGVGSFTEKIILEILETGTSEYFTKIMTM